MKYACIILVLMSCAIASGAETVTKPAKRPMVLANYYTWYTTPWGTGGRFGHWASESASELLPRPSDPANIVFPPAIREMASTSYPLVGLYDSMNKDIVRWHIRLAKAAGIDGFMVDWWGPATWQKPSGWTHDVFVNTVLPVAEEEHFKVMLFDETPQFVSDFESIKQWTVQYLKKFKDSPAWLHIDGKPAWGVYQLWEGKLTAKQGQELIDHVEKQVGPVYWIVDRMRARDQGKGLELFTPEDWLAIPQIDCIMGYAMFSTARIYEYKDIAPIYKAFAASVHKSGKKVMLPVHPGHDNRKSAATSWVIPRRNGETLKDFWRAATDAKVDFIEITSWNEWPESTVVEPSMTWPDPYLYLKIIAEFQGRKFNAPPLPPLGSLDPAMREYLENVPK